MASLVAYQNENATWTFSFNDNSTPPNPIDLTGKSVTFSAKDVNGLTPFTAVAATGVGAGTGKNQATVTLPYTVNIVSGAVRLPN